MGPSTHPTPPPGEPNSLLKSASTFVREREALERLIASGEFHRSPNLEKILTYLCQQFFLGQGNQVKEYTIAIEALDRRDDFDPKRDSIVRVEMHRLRRRLKDYYSSRGAHDTIRITIPDKSYVPEFINVGQDSSAVIAVAEESTPVEADSVWIRVRRKNATLHPLLIPVISAVVILAAIGLWWANRSPASASSDSISRAAEFRPASVVADTIPRALPSTSGGTEFRIMAGRPKGRYPDRYGQLWQGDDFFTGGAAVPVENEVRARGFDTNLFSNKREGDFTYEIPANPGVYELTLYFAETSFGEGNVFGGGESNRQFHIHINGRAELVNFDVLADAHDTSSATARVFKDVHPHKDGKIHLRFESSLTGKAFVNAIMLRPGIEGMIRPIRIVCRPSLYRDSLNEQWEPDHFYRGGIQITRPTGPAAPRDPDVFRGERYGKFTYSIPVPPGKYQARLYFSEYWWGPDRPGLGGAGSRVFDVFCNFRPLLLNYDIYKKYSKTRYAVETFRGLEPNLSSQLVFDFEPRVNFALLNAIEIADDSHTFPPR